MYPQKLLEEKRGGEKAEESINPSYEKLNWDVQFGGRGTVPLLLWKWGRGHWTKGRGSGRENGRVKGREQRMWTTQHTG